MHKLICIVGPTGTGKTVKAIELSKQQPSIIVSADSRQVYRGMDIVTGKDHPHGVKIYGIDIVNPDEQCSVSVWHDAVAPIIQNLAPNIQIIVVGGTGLYVKALIQGIPTMGIPIDQPLRDELNLLSINELQNKLIELNKYKYESMNHSDQLNSRRLIRAIEVVKSGITPTFITPNIKINMIGLRCIDDSNHRYRITQRVKNRIEQGAISETKKLLIKYDRNIQSMSAIGYKSIINFLENKCTKQEMIDSWVEGEISYAKRQLTWFRKQPVIWYDVDTYGKPEN